MSGGDRDYNDVVVSLRPTSATALTTLQVPGATNRTVPVTATLKSAKKTPTDTGSTTAGGEVGFFIVDNATGSIGNLTPGSSGYVAAALGRAQVLFAQGASVANTTTDDLTGGQFLVFYYVPNGTAAQVLANNSTNSPTGSKVAFFSLSTANPDGKEHSRTFQPERVTRAAPTTSDPLFIHMMGKVNGTSSDFDDVVFTVGFGGEQRPAANGRVGASVDSSCPDYHPGVAAMSHGRMAELILAIGLLSPAAAADPPAEVKRLQRKLRLRRTFSFSRGRHSPSPRPLTSRP